MGQKVFCETRSYERTRIVYFPVHLLLKGIFMAWTGRRAKVLKIGFFMLIFKIVHRIVRNRATPSKDRPTEKHIDKRTQSINYKYLVPYLSNKKKEF